MNRPERGRHLIAADRGFATGGGPAARLAGAALSGGFHRMLDRIDAGLEAGAIAAALPDGTERMLGGRGPGPTAVVRLHDWRALARLATSGSVGWYKAWARGEWSSPDPVPLFDLFMRNAARLGDVARAKGLFRLINRIAHALRGNRRARARANIAFHYDLGNDFYAAWLDPGMTYSSAIYPSAEASLEAAQAHKNRLLLRRLALAPGQRLLEIGCGWGSLMEMAAGERGAEVTGLTLSREQKEWAEARLAAAGLGERTRVLLTDYRDVRGQYDAVASVEMVEAVGRDYWPAYLGAIADLLKPGGRAALQYIAIRDDLFARYAASADFIQTYIFPGGMLIAEGEFRRLAEGAGLVWRDRTGHGLHYARTLAEWRARYDRAVAEERLPDGFDPAFHDLWCYYLMYCEGGFRGGGIDVAQVTLEKPAR